MSYQLLNICKVNTILVCIGPLADYVVFIKW